MHKTNRKGFTIVELAIVLVVIGIILGMAVKGKALVDTARMRAAVAKINKFEAAAHIWYAKTGNMPDNMSGTSRVDTNIFFDAGILSPGDIKEPISGNDWYFQYCSVSPLDSTILVDYQVQRNPLTNLCVFGWKGTAAQRISTELVCNIEVIKDDENTTSGAGRGRTWAFVLPEDSYKDCSVWKGRSTRPNISGEDWMYMIF